MVSSGFQKAWGLNSKPLGLNHSEDAGLGQKRTVAALLFEGLHPIM